MNNYAVRAKKYREFKESSPSEIYKIAITDLKGNYKNVYKKWSKMNDSEKQLVVERECQKGHNTVDIGNGWEKFDNSNPFLSFSSQALLADTIICSSAQLTKYGYHIVKIGGKMALTSGLSIPGTISGFSKILSPKVLTKEVLKFSPRISASIIRLTNKFIAKKILEKIEVMLAKIAVKTGLRTSISAGVNVIPIAGQIASAGLILWGAYDLYELGIFNINCGKLKKANNRLSNDSNTVCSYDKATEDYINNYISKKTISSEEDTKKYTEEAISKIPKGKYTLELNNTKIEYTISQGDVTKVKMTKGGEIINLDLGEIKNIDLEKIKIKNVNAIKFEAGFTQLKLNYRNSNYIEVARYDNSEKLFIVKNGEQYEIKGYPDLKFNTLPKAILLANLMNKVKGIYNSNNSDNEFESNNEISLDDSYIWDTTWLSKEKLNWYTEQLGVTSEDICKIFNKMVGK